MNPKHSVQDDSKQMHTELSNNLSKAEYTTQKTHAEHTHSNTVPDACPAQDKDTCLRNSYNLRKAHSKDLFSQERVHCIVCAPSKHPLYYET